MTADEVKELLGLAPHPKEGGYFVRTYEAAEAISADAFKDGRYDGARRTGTAIYYLLEPGMFSEMHRLKSDEVFHLYMGDAVEMLQLRPNGSGCVVILGTDLLAGRATAGGGGSVGCGRGRGCARGGGWALMGVLGEPGVRV